MAPQTDVGKIKMKQEMYNLDTFAPSYLILMKPIYDRKVYCLYLAFNFFQLWFEAFFSSINIWQIMLTVHTKTVSIILAPF
jgi:hypothetical protein